MQIRFENSPAETAKMGTKELRDNFLIENIMQPDKINLTYSHYDRMIIGAAVPVAKEIFLPNEPELKASFFLERRELGIINTGNKGTVTADGIDFELEQHDCLYLGKGTRSVSFKSETQGSPARFYLLSAPAHHSYPNKLKKKNETVSLNLGEPSTSNQRKLYKYIYNDGIESCQLVMGITILENGSVWNSVPPHIHTRRMEVYFYFDLNEAHRVMHFMGEPQETRHIIVSNNEAVISPPWSMHFGAGSSSYGFIWGMAGENKEFTDMDAVAINQIK
jgi:4-deoxy-L-threo-5-hexosulose-uronate ketol-isomerase